MSLGPALNQKNPKLRPDPNPNDLDKSINDCWAVAANQAARSEGGRYTGPGAVVIDGMSIADIPTFRKAAGVPDLPGVKGGGGIADIERGIHALYPHLRTYTTSTWATFVAKARAGGSFVLVVNSSKLPAAQQYGFKGIHAISGRCIVLSGGEVWYVINPLQPQGSSAVKISLAALKAAFLGACLVKPAVVAAPAPVPVPAPAPAPVPAPKTYDEGYANGHMDGHAEGYAEGYADGHHTGYNGAMTDAITALTALELK